MDNQYIVLADVSRDAAQDVWDGEMIFTIVYLRPWCRQDGSAIDERYATAGNV